MTRLQEIADELNDDRDWIYTDENGFLDRSLVAQVYGLTMEEVQYLDRILVGVSHD